MIDINIYYCFIVREFVYEDCMICYVKCVIVSLCILYYNVCWDLVGDELLVWRLFCLSVEFVFGNKMFF